MTNTEAGLLDDILANPDDDVPRLIYADWLEDHDRRNTARFIRQQIAGEVGMVPLLDVVKIVDPMGIGGLGRRNASKKECFWKRNDSSERLVFRRGFLAEIHAPLAVLLEHLPRLVGGHPIEAVRATDREPYEGIAGILGGGRFVVGWHPLINPGDPRRTDELPRSIFDLLIPGIASSFGRGKYYPTADAAHAALSVALLKWAKAQKLQPVKTP